MTTGTTLYLVSACSTAEEFVAAFRRYTDRTGLFVPTTQPLPAGRRGRLALTLTDGGVMIEGEAEILQSSVKPTVLHGRPGMTVKFVDADELSKTVIGELEKARLALKPAPPSVAPRPASVPAEPRPTVPAVAGRIDAANARAECVVIGDVSALVETKAAPGKLVVPSIPAAPGRPKQPTAPPDLSRSKPTSIGFPVIEKPPAPAVKPAVAHEDEPTAIGLTPPTKQDGVPRSSKSFETQPVGTVRPPLVPEASARSGPASPGPRGKNPTRPPLTPRHPTPVAPVPIVRPPAKRAPTVDDAVVENAIVAEEKTDLSEIPQAPVATPVSANDAVTVPTALDVPPAADKKQRSGGMRASEIMAAIPEGDWTMAPDAAEPTALLAEKVEPPKGPPTGNWSIALDPETGWSEPKKIEAPPAPPPAPPKQRTPNSGNPDIAVAKDEGFDAVAWEDKPTHIGEKIEIDSTLMEPLTPMPPSGSVPNAAPPPMPPPAYVPPPMPPPAYVPMPMPTPMPSRAVRPTSKRRTVYVVAGVGALVVALLVFALTRGSSKPAATKVITLAPADAAIVVADAAVEQVETPAPAAPEAPPAKTTCTTTVTSVPTGAEVYQGDRKVGTTPAKLELPCGVEAKLTLKKAKFSPTSRAFTPADGKANKVSIRLVKPTFAVKVVSTPAGATVTVGGRSMGVTPASIRLPAFQASSVVVSKPGYVTDKTSVTPKVNNSLHSVTLKKGRAR